jgi:hypothetical protein
MLYRRVGSVFLYYCACVDIGAYYRRVCQRLSKAGLKDVQLPKKAYVSVAHESPFEP